MGLVALRGFIDLDIIVLVVALDTANFPATVFDGSDNSRIMSFILEGCETTALLSRLSLHPQKRSETGNPPRESIA